MGLTVYYDWKTKIDAPSARRMIAKFRALAAKLPFDDVSEIYEQDPPDGKSVFRRYRHSFRQGALYLPRTRADGEKETVDVPALHALFFHVNVRGAETASIGLASHPPVVVHQEDIIERNEDGSESGRLLGQGDPVEFPTRRRGYYSWHSFCKTQYAGNPKLGGEANFLKAHLSLIELLDQIRASGVNVRIRDDSRYAKHGDVDRLLRCLRDWDALVARFVGNLGDALEVLERIESMPEIYGVVWQDVRAARLKRFRHVVYYVVFADRVEVLAVLHGARDAAAWRSRA
jgi:plasmid stabilization system protein ParE